MSLPTDFISFCKIHLETVQLYPEYSLLIEMMGNRKDFLWEQRYLNFAFTYWIYDHLGLACHAIEIDDNCALWKFLVSQSLSTYRGPERQDVNPNQIYDMVSVLRNNSNNPLKVICNIVDAVKTGENFDFVLLSDSPFNRTRLFTQLIIILNKLDRAFSLQPTTNEVFRSLLDYPIAVETWYDEQYPQRTDNSDELQPFDKPTYADKLKALEVFGVTDLHSYNSPPFYMKPLQNYDLLHLVLLWFRHTQKQYTPNAMLRLREAQCCAVAPVSPLATDMQKRLTKLVSPL